MCIAVFPSQGSLWLNNSLYPPISLHHLSSSFKSTQYFLNPQVPTDLKKKQKTTNPQPKEESACDLLENWLIFSNSPFSTLGLQILPQQPWIGTDTLAWGRKGKWITVLGRKKHKALGCPADTVPGSPSQPKAAQHPRDKPNPAPSSARTFPKGQGQGKL